MSIAIEGSNFWGHEIIEFGKGKVGRSTNQFILSSAHLIPVFVVSAMCFHMKYFTNLKTLDYEFITFCTGYKISWDLAVEVLSRRHIEVYEDMC